MTRRHRESRLSAESPSEKGRLAGLAEFLPQFEQAGFEFARWIDPKSDKPGEFTMPFSVLSETASAFVQVAYDLGWVRGDINWPEWKHTPKAIRLRDEQAALANATAEDLACLLTTIIRQDRFCEGELAAAFDSGLLTRIVRRAAQLAGEIT